MPAYDAVRFDPPAPLAQVTVRPSAQHAGSEALMLIDTGADVTLLPKSVVEQLGIAPPSRRNTS